MSVTIKLAGCVISDTKGNILLLHRNTAQLKQWELPGGKIEPGETPEQAAAREVQEELGVRVEIVKHLGSQGFIDQGSTFHYAWYSATITEGKPKVSEPEKFDGLGYFSPNDLLMQKDILSVNVHNLLAHTDYNQKTLQTYEANAQQYIDKTPVQASPHVREWIDRALKHIPKTAQILEIGSAFGRDADYMESKGYVVQRTDAAKSFVALLRSNGKQAEVLNILTDELTGPYDLVFANAVFLHFKPAEFKGILRKIYASLKPNARLAFAVKKGTGSGWSSDRMEGPRFFCYWQPDDLKKLIAEAGFKNIGLTEGKSRNAEWLHVITSKPKKLKP